MQRKSGILAGNLLVLSLGAGALLAQGMAGVSGLVSDTKGNKAPDMVVVIKSPDTGAEYTVKTDKNGIYKQIGIRPGVYELTLKMKDSDKPIVEGLKCNVTSDSDNHCDIDIKKLLAAAPEIEAARKKQEEEQKKFTNMKAAFDAGVVKADAADKAHADMLKAPADQRASLQPNVTGLYQQALDSFTQAQQSAPDKDPNLHLVYFKLGYVDEALGKYPEAIEAYQKAVELKPASADYLINLALVQAKGNKTPDAIQSCEKAATIDQSKAAQCWTNMGIILYNANRLPEAVAPLQKATSLNPNFADAWYLLGASLLSTMQTKQENDKLTYIVTPGTVEAYQKYLALAPNGRYAGDAQASLQALASLGAGVDTKVKVKKKP